MTPPLPPSLAEQLAGIADRYRIERELGAGGMATVYLAEDVKHRRKVALKVLHPELSAVLGGERFLKEIELTASLQHPHILPLFDSGESGGQLFYVMPFVEGETLRTRLEREKQLPIGDSLQLVREVADALQYAHDRGVIHRDIKPENILLQGGHALVADFGIALAVQQAGGTRMTQTGLSLGTPHYMSPEQAMGEKTIDARADVYALGAVAYEMLAGEPPFTGATAQAIVARVLVERPRALSTVRDRVPAQVAEAIDTALAKLPADRFATAREFAQALVAGERAGGTQQGATATVARTSGAPTAGWKRNLPWAVAGAFAFATVALAMRGGSAPVPDEQYGRFSITLPESTAVTNLSVGRRIALSPDGSRIVMTLRTPNATSVLYVRRAGEEAFRRLDGTEGASHPVVSPDGRWILYYTAWPARLMKVPIDGGTPKRVALLSEASRALGGIAWGTSDRVVASWGRGLWVTDPEGRDLRELPRPDSSLGVERLLTPDVLPDGRHALVTIYRLPKPGRDSLTLGVVDLESGALTDLKRVGIAPHHTNVGHILYTGEQQALLASPFDADRLQLTGEPVEIMRDVFSRGYVGYGLEYATNEAGWIVYQTGGERPHGRILIVDVTGRERELTTEARDYEEFSVSPDGRRLVVRVGTGDRAEFFRGDLWTIDLASGASMPITRGDGSYRPQWSHDGRRIYHLARIPGSVNSGAGRVVVRAADGSGGDSVIVVHPSGIAQVVPGPDGKWSIVRTLAPRDLFIAPTDSLAQLRPFLTTPENESAVALSANGSLVAFMSDATGAPEIYVRPVPGPGGQVAVSIGGGDQPRWSADGQKLFYRGGGHLLSATIARTPELRVTARDTLFRDSYQDGVAIEPLPNGREFVAIKGGATIGGRVGILLGWHRLLRDSTLRVAR